MQKNFVSFLVSNFLILASSWGQSSIQDCLGAIPICQETYIQPFNYTGEGNLPNEITSGCLDQGEVNGVWYTVTPQSNGTLSFIISPGSPSDDFDWSVYNITNRSCADISQPGALVSCNFSDTPGFTGANGFNQQTSADENDSPFNSVIPVQAGETYALYISAFRPARNGYVIDFRTSTASLFDNTPPFISHITAPSCGDNAIQLEFNEAIQCNSLNSSDFTLIGPDNVAINSILSSDCANGANSTNSLSLILNKSLQVSGTYQVVLSGDILDVCGNSNGSNSPISFQIEGISNTIDTSSVSCLTNDGSIQLNTTGGSGNYGYLWSPSVSTNSFAYNLEARSYVILTTDDNTCQTIDTVNLIPKHPVTAEIISITSPKCFGEANGQAFISINETNPPYQIEWSNGLSQDELFNFALAEGDYTVQITNDKNCHTTLPFSISNPERITMNSINDTTLCRNDEIQFSFNSNNGFGEVKYVINQSDTVGSEYSYQVSNPETLTVFSVDENGCKSEIKSIHLGINTAIQANLNVDTSICFGTELNALCLTSGGIPPYRYMWNDSIVDDEEFTNKEYTQESIKVAVQDVCNETPVIVSKPITLLELPEGNISVSDSIGCPPLSSSISFSSSPIKHHVWEMNNQSILDPSISVTNSKSGCYPLFLHLTDENECRNTIGDSCYIRIHPTPETNFVNNPDTAIFLNPEYTFFNITENYDRQLWELEDGSSYNSSGFTHTFADTGMHEVKLTTWNEFNCKSSISREVSVIYLFTAFAPNGFSPNGDGINDEFNIQFNGVKPKSFNIQIYDRWGKLLFQSDNPDFSWDGKVRHSSLPIGTYIYRYQLVDIHGVEHDKSGSITLIY